MLSLAELVDAVDFKPEKIYLADGEKEVRIDYRLLEDKASFPLACFLELVPVEGHVYFVERSWQGETDLHCDTSVLELLKKADEKCYNEKGQKISKYLLAMQNALTDLRFGDQEGIMELVSLLEVNEEF